MNLTPPKFIQALRSRDREDLVAALRGLADKWDSYEADTMSSISGEVESRACAWELRKVLDEHS